MCFSPNFIASYLLPVWIGRCWMSGTRWGCSVLKERPSVHVWIVAELRPREIPGYKVQSFLFRSDRSGWNRYTGQNWTFSPTKCRNDSYNIVKVWKQWCFLRKGSANDIGSDRTKHYVAKEWEGEHDETNSHNHGNQASGAVGSWFVIEICSACTTTSDQGRGRLRFFATSSICEALC